MMRSFQAPTISSASFLRAFKLSVSFAIGLILSSQAMEVLRPILILPSVSAGGILLCGSDSKRSGGDQFEYDVFL